jgi:hypothetical protein
MAKKAQKLNIFQRRYIDERLKSLRYSGRSFATPPKPAEVRKAEKICESWQRDVDRQRRAFDKKRSDRHTAAYRAVHFGQPEEALAALDAYEAEVRG